jgi:hypothetical protein
LEGTLDRKDVPSLNSVRVQGPASCVALFHTQRSPGIYGCA